MNELRLLYHALTWYPANVFFFKIKIC